MPVMCPCLCLLSLSDSACRGDFQVPQIFLGGAAAFAATSAVCPGAGTGHTAHSCHARGDMELLKDSGFDQGS